MKINLRESLLAGAVIIVTITLGTALVFIVFVPPRNPTPKPLLARASAAPTLDTPASQPAISNLFTSTGVIQRPVQWSDLAALAQSINLKQDLSDASINSTGLNARERTKWAHALEQAHTLQSGMCDCDQVNYLNHFISCGEYAMTGDPKFVHAVIELQSLKLEN